MPNYAVHIFPHVRVKIIGITADTPAEALAKTEHVNLDLLKQYNINSGLGNGMVAVDVEHDASAIEFAMVDTMLPTGEVDYDEAVWLNGDGTPLIDGLTHAEVKAKNSDLALKFYEELLDSTETFTAIADTHGAITLADVIYLQAAILKGTHIETEDGGESHILDLVMQLPSATTWVGYIKEVGSSSDSGQMRAYEAFVQKASPEMEKALPQSIGCSHGVKNKQDITWRFHPDPAPSAQSLLSCDNLNKGISFGSPELNLSNPGSTRWTATVIRTGYGSRVIEVESDKPISEREARSIAIEKAGNYVFSEHGSDYEIEDIH